MNHNLSVTCFFIYFALFNYSESLSQEIEWIQTYYEQDNYLNSVHFVDEYNGFAVGDGGTILHSSDGGVYWVAQLSGTSDELRAVHFADSTTGVVVGDNGTILSTIDGGQNWTQIDQIGQGFTFVLDAMFVNSEIGWVIGNDVYDDEGEVPQPVVWKTLDGGVSWQESYLDYSYLFIRGCHFIDENIGWLVGLTIDEVNDEITTGSILKTEDGGNSWDPVEYGSLVNDFTSVFFIDENRGWVLGSILTGEGNEEQNLFRTIDGGVNWIRLNLPELSRATSIHFISQSRGVFAGLGRIWYTSDGGNTWSEEFRDGRNNLFSVQLSESGRGWAVGSYSNWSSGKIFMRTDYTTIENTPQTTNPAHPKLVQNYPNPFNPSTSIEFEIMAADHVILQILDLSGRPVLTLVDEFMSIGLHTVQFGNVNLSSGIYFYRIKTGDYTSTKKMVLNK